MKQRKYTSDEKLAVVLEMLKGQKPVSQICKENGIRDSLAYRFRDEALDGMKSGLSGSQKRGSLGADAEKDRKRSNNPILGKGKRSLNQAVVCSQFQGSKLS